jgi:phospholipid/cholesterol/gamma-HCH transport system permease protein
MIAALGANTIRDITNIGKFSRFFWQAMAESARSCVKTETYSLIWVQMNLIGVRSVPIIMVTGAFVGMILAIQAYDQLAGMGLEEHLGGEGARSCSCCGNVGRSCRRGLDG